MVIRRHFGSQISVQAADLYLAADGRIVGERRQLDLLGMKQQNSAVPAW